MKKQLATLAFAIAAASLNTAAFAAPETYVADSSHTFSRFSYSHFGYSTQQSRFNKNSGKAKPLAAAAAVRPPSNLGKKAAAAPVAAKGKAKAVVEDSEVRGFSCGWVCRILQPFGFAAEMWPPRSWGQMSPAAAL